MPRPVERHVGTRIQARLGSDGAYARGLSRWRCFTERLSGKATPQWEDLGERRQNLIVRALQVALMVASTIVLLGVPWAIAQRSDAPAHDNEGRVREALEHAFGEGSAGRLELEHIIDDDWERLFVFAPYTSHRAMKAAIGSEGFDSDLDFVPQDSTLFVFVRDDRVVATPLIPRAPVDASCMADVRKRALTPADRPAVNTAVVGGATVLAAGADRPRLLRACLARLPRRPAGA